jgi:uncharacterized protein (TIGR00156 family)
MGYKIILRNEIKLAREEEMKKRLVFVVFIMAAVFAGIAGADERKGGGYTGPSSTQVSKVSEVKTMPDNTVVVLEGKIESYLGDEKYRFSDGSDTITIEIDNDEWNGLEAGANDVVVIYGEVDKKFRRVEIEVEKIEKKKI